MTIKTNHDYKIVVICDEMRLVIKGNMYMLYKINFSQGCQTIQRIKNFLPLF